MQRYTVLYMQSLEQLNLVYVRTLADDLEDVQLQLIDYLSHSQLLGDPLPLEYVVAPQKESRQVQRLLVYINVT